MKGPNNSYLFGPFAYFRPLRLTPAPGDSAYLAVATRLRSVFYDVIHAVVPPALKAIWRPTIRGLEHVPRRAA